MSHAAPSRLPRPISFLFENSIFLIAGTIAALCWANTDVKSYNDFTHFSIVGADAHHAHSHDDHKTDSHAQNPDNQSQADAEHTYHADHDHGDAEHADSTEAKSNEESGFLTDLKHIIQRPDKTTGHHHGITIHFLINDILMALFFATAAGEVWEALLPGGSLSNPKKAATPLLATVGGIAGPALLYLGLAAILGETKDYGAGWAIPCATDIAFTYMVARLIFGSSHPAIAFLLLLAIADDAAGLVILAIFYPSKAIAPEWFLLTIASMLACLLLRKLKVQNFWVYLLGPGLLCWISFDVAGIHPALGLVPIIPCLPHAHTDLGIYAKEELNRHDTLNELMHWWKNPIEIILGLFGLANAGVEFNTLGVGTYLVLFGLIVGKPFGICLFTLLAKGVFKLEIPSGMTMRHILLIGIISSIGFTVALFVTTAAFGDSSILVRDAAKMGALLSFLGAPLAFIAAKLLKIRPEPANVASE